MHVSHDRTAKEHTSRASSADSGSHGTNSCGLNTKWLDPMLLAGSKIPTAEGTAAVRHRRRDYQACESRVSVLRLGVKMQKVPRTNHAKQLRNSRACDCEGSLCRTRKWVTTKNTPQCLEIQSFETVTKQK